MFDIIGYWSAVTFYTGVILIPVIAVLVAAFSYLLLFAIPDKDDARKASDWVWCYDYGPESYSFFGGKGKAFLLVYLLPFVCAATAALVVGIEACDKGRSLIEQIAFISEASYPVFTYIGIVTVIFALLFLAIRKGYSAYKLAEKVKSHIADANIHN